MDQVADTIEQRLEQAVEQIETMLATIDQERATLQGEEQQRAIAALQRTAGKIERTLQEVDATMPVSDKADDRQDAAVQSSVLAELDNAVAHVERALPAGVFDIPKCGTGPTTQHARSLLRTQCRQALPERGRARHFLIRSTMSDINLWPHFRGLCFHGRGGFRSDCVTPRRGSA